MALSMYDVSIPALIRGLNNLSAVLDKGDAHARAQGIDPAELVRARLRDDMYALDAQVQRASDTAKGCGARLAGIEVPSFADTETTFAELRAHRQDDRFPEDDPARAARRQRVAHDRAAVARRRDDVRRQVVPGRLCAAELLFPYDDRVRHPAAQGRAARQDGLSRRALTRIRSWLPRPASTGRGRATTECYCMAGAPRRARLVRAAPRGRRRKNRPAASIDGVACAWRGEKGRETARLVGGRISREGDARRSGQRRRTDAMRRRTKPGEMHDMT